MNIFQFPIALICTPAGLLIYMYGYFLPKIVKGYNNFFAYKSNLAKRDGKTFGYSQEVLGLYLRRSGAFLLIAGLSSLMLDYRLGFPGISGSGLLVVLTIFISIYKTEMRLRKRYR